MEFVGNSNITARRYFETNDSHLIVDTASPFNPNQNRRYKVRINDANLLQCKKYGVEVPDSDSALLDSSNKLINEIIDDYALNRNEELNDFYQEDYTGANNMRQVPNLPLCIIDSQYASTCSKDAPKTVNFNPRVTFGDNSNKEVKQPHLTPEQTNVKKYAEKTTYCRPILNLYNQEFVWKTMQRNARLQRLVQKLVMARNREKQETWNNYINELKNKHRYGSSELMGIRTVLKDKSDKCELICDDFRTRFAYGQSSHCQNLLQDFYDASANMSTNTDNNYPLDYNNMPNSMGCLPNSDSYCYPISSQGRFMMLQRKNDLQRKKNACHLLPQAQPGRCRNHTIILDKYCIQGKGRRRFISTRATSANFQLESENSIKMHDVSSQAGPKYGSVHSRCVGVVTNVDICMEDQKKYNTRLQNEEDFTNREDKSIQKGETTRKELEKVCSTVIELKKKLQEAEEKQKGKSLSGIEKKLDTLIKSINMFIKEPKNIVNRISKSTYASEFVDTECSRNNVSTSTTKRGKQEQVFYSMLQNGTRSAFTLSDHDDRFKNNSLSKIDKILHEEMDKSNKIKQDIESLLKLQNDKPCSMHISFDIPTRERSTEVTHSLSKTAVETSTMIEEINPSVLTSDKCMTIAVNTDPLGLLALLRVSTETVKQILSYVPQIDCYSYLSMLQFPQLPSTCVSHYICNICGAAFGRPSQLSDHIQRHNLGTTRDCCVCRHALDRRHKRTALYSCQYCGQRFTRAYCCELHQQSCAKQLGKKHDVASELVLLK